MGFTHLCTCINQRQDSAVDELHMCCIFSRNMHAAVYVCASTHASTIKDVKLSTLSSLGCLCLQEVCVVKVVRRQKACVCFSCVCTTQVLSCFDGFVLHCMKCDRGAFLWLWVLRIQFMQDFAHDHPHHLVAETQLHKNLTEEGNIDSGESFVLHLNTILRYLKVIHQ